MGENEKELKELIENAFAQAVALEDVGEQREAEKMLAVAIDLENDGQ